MNKLSAKDVYRLWKLSDGMAHAAGQDVKATRAGWTWADDFPSVPGKVRMLNCVLRTLQHTFNITT